MCLVLCGTCLGSYCFAEGEKEVQYINISTASDFVAFANKCRLDTWSENVVVTLTNDIRLTGKYTPAPIFSGIFDGQNHTISGVDVNGSFSRAGLFGLLTEEAQVKNLVVSGTIAPSGDVLCAGGIAGENRGYIESCVFTGSVSSKTTSGGIAGYNSGVINGCANFGEIDVGIRKNTKISLKTLKTAGIKGIFEYITNGTLDSTSDRSGGITGDNFGSILSCKNLGLVGALGKSQNVGGITGYNSGYIALCTNSASIQGTKNVGGIAGMCVPYVKASYTDDLLSGTVNEIDNVLALVDSLTYDIDKASSDINRSINDILSAVGYASTCAGNVGTQATSFVNGKLYEVNEIKDYANTAVSGLEGVTDGVAVIGTNFNNGLGNFSNGVKNIKSYFNSDPEDPNRDQYLSDAMTNFSSGIGNVQTAVGGLSTATENLHKMFSDLDSEGLPSFNSISPEFTNSITALTSSLNAITARTTSLSNDLGSTVKALTQNVRKITSEAQNIVDSIYSTAYSLSDLSLSTFIYNASGEAFSSGEGNFGIIQNCVNTGSAEGENNIGGIAGSMGLPNSAYIDDPDEKTGIALKILQYRSILSKCKSYGDVIASSENAGGIVGDVVIGAITECEGYSYVHSDGSFVGGIVGSNHGLVRNSFVRSTLSGKSYVGGISGGGDEKQLILDESTLVGNFAEVQIFGCDQHKGGISGDDIGCFIRNYFVSSTLNGIDEFSTEAMAAPITRKDLLGVQNCPEEFSWTEAQLQNVTSGGSGTVSSTSAASASTVIKVSPWLLVLAVIFILALIFLIIFAIAKFISALRREKDESEDNSDDDYAKKPAARKGKSKPVPAWKDADSARSVSWKDPEDEQSGSDGVQQKHAQSWKDT